MGGVKLALVGWLCSGHMEQTAKVKVSHDIQSKDGMCVLSDELDDFLTYDALMDSFIEHACKLKSIPNLPGLKWNFKELSDSEFLITANVSNDEDSKEEKVHIKIDREKGDLFTVWQENDMLISTDVFKLHQNPLRVEAWVSTAVGQRLAGRNQALEVIALLDFCIDREKDKWMF